MFIIFHLLQFKEKYKKRSHNLYSLFDSGVDAREFSRVFLGLLPDFPDLTLALDLGFFEFVPVLDPGVAL